LPPLERWVENRFFRQEAILPAAPRHWWSRLQNWTWGMKKCEAFMKLKDINKRDVYELLKKVNDFRKNKDYKKAIRYFKRALEQHPNDYRMYSAIGYSYYE
jgi:tetratricopeptide (TPR) repeat protein